MKKKELAAYIGKPLSECEKELAAQRERFLKLRADIAQGKVKNIQEMKLVKKSIAQLLTLMQKKQHTL